MSRNIGGGEEKEKKEYTNPVAAAVAGWQAGKSVAHIGGGDASPRTTLPKSVSAMDIFRSKKFGGY